MHASCVLHFIFNFLVWLISSIHVKTVLATSLHAGNSTQTAKQNKNKLNQIKGNLK